MIFKSVLQMQFTLQLLLTNLAVFAPDGSILQLILKTVTTNTTTPRPSVNRGLCLTVFYIIIISHLTIKNLIN